MPTERSIQVTWRASWTRRIKSRLHFEDVEFLSEEMAFGRKEWRWLLEALHICCMQTRFMALTPLGFNKCKVYLLQPHPLHHLWRCPVNLLRVACFPIGHAQYMFYFLPPKTLSENIRKWYGWATMKDRVSIEKVHEKWDVKGWWRSR